MSTSIQQDDPEFAYATLIDYSVLVPTEGFQTLKMSRRSDEFKQKQVEFVAVTEHPSSLPIFPHSSDFSHFDLNWQLIHSDKFLLKFYRLGSGSTAHVKPVIYRIVSLKNRNATSL